MAKKIKNTLKLLGVAVLLSKLRFFVKLWFDVNWTKTLYFNYKAFPLTVAFKLPVFIYGKVKISKLSGTIEILAPIKTAMIGLGQPYELFCTSAGIAQINIQGRVRFKGHFQMGPDYFLCVGGEGVLELGDMSSMGRASKLICTKQIIFSKCARIGFESQVIDSTFHKMIDLTSNKSLPRSGCIFIGENNYIGNRVSIMKGAITQEGCTVASNSLCNKDLSVLPLNSIVGGMPAKLIKENVSRDWENESLEFLRVFK